MAAGIMAQFIMHTKKSVFYSVSVLLLAGLAVDAATQATEEVRNPFAGDATAAIEGKQLFIKNGCYACHGHEAEGAVGPDLTDDDWIYAPSDKMIFNTIAKGRKGTVMSPFAGQMTPEEIWKVVEFLRDKNRQRNAK